MLYKQQNICIKTKYTLCLTEFLYPFQEKNQNDCKHQPDNNASDIKESNKVTCKLKKVI
mgnify:CR=1 FL=1